MKGLPKIDGEEMQNINRTKWEVDIHNFLWIFLLSLVIRVWLIHKFPVIYDWDGYNRLVHNESFFVGKWLPLLQSFIVILSKVNSDPGVHQIHDCDYCWVYLLELLSICRYII